MTTTSIRALRSRVGGYAKWAKTTDRTAATAPARDAFLRRFYDATPTELPDATRLQMAESARKAYFASLALKSALVRRSRSDAKRVTASERRLAGIAHPEAPVTEEA